ncbi:MAG TPA: hypothetical protein DCO75_05180 [Fibrobacteres bacterium]|jgi:hypothetical protein|nr:hypothetical protein [Fibrobacterota bacterium]
MNAVKKYLCELVAGCMTIISIGYTVNAQSLPFYDNFNDNNDNGWIKPEGGNWTVSGGIYSKDAVSMDYDGHYISYVGDSTWKDYSVSVNARIVDASTGWASLEFRILNSGNYYTFQIEPATHCAKLERRTDFSSTILQVTTSLSLSSNTWYELKVKVIGDYVYCYIDNALIFSYKGILIPSGGAGLAAWHMNSQFDNFSVTSACTPIMRTFSLPFYDNFNDNNDSGWIKPEGGNWTVADSVYTKDCVSMSYDGHYISYVGDNSWSDYTVSVKARTVDSSTGWASLEFRILDDGTYYTFQIEPATTCAKLEQRTAHSTTILKTTYSYPLSNNTWYNLKVKVVGDSAYCYIDSTLIFSYKGILIPSGGAGLASWHMNSQFDDFSVIGISNQELLSDKFNYDIDSGWIKPDGGKWKIHSGVYTKDTVSSCYDGRYISYRGDSLWADYTVSVDARTNDSSVGWSSLIVRVQDSNACEGIGNYYAFQINPSTNTARFGMFSNCTFTTLVERNDFCLTNDRWYNIKVKVSGDTAACFLDNTLVFSEGGLNIKSGGTGLASFHTNADYDNFSVENITLGESTPVISSSQKTNPAFSAITISLRNIRYNLPAQCHVNLNYYDLKGRCIASLVNSIQQPGEHSVAYPKNIAAGNYIVSLKAGVQEITKKIIISK